MRVQSVDAASKRGRQCGWSRLVNRRSSPVQTSAGGVNRGVVAEQVMQLGVRRPRSGPERGRGKAAACGPL